MASFRWLYGFIIVLPLQVGCGDSGNESNPTPQAAAGQAGQGGSAGSGQGGAGAGGAGAGGAGQGGAGQGGVAGSSGSGGGGAGGSSSGLSVSNANARGCEVLLTEKGGKVQRVTFEGSVKGTFLREAPRVAVTFVSKEDSPIAAGVVKIEGGPLSGVEVTKVSCVDKSGAKLPDTKITLVGGAS